MSLSLVYIYGAGHSGSTLLNLLLNGHSEMLGLSEVIHINTKWMTETPSHREFWGEVRERYNKRSLREFDTLQIGVPPGLEAIRWTSERKKDWAVANQEFFDCVAETSGRSVLVDSSKGWQRLHLLLNSSEIRLKVIHLVRDGRAVVNSYMRKEVSFLQAYRAWAVPTLLAALLRRKCPPGDWYTQRYEDLAREPETCLQAIANFLELEFQSSMLKYRQGLYVGIGGNGMRRSSEEAIRLDEKWRSQMPRAARVRFAVLGGWLNRAYGYSSTAS